MFINNKLYISIFIFLSSVINTYSQSEKTYFHEECKWDDCEKPLLSELQDPIIWHRDAWNTNCPWDALYEQINNGKCFPL